jgi:hypothetical protein
VGQHLKEEKKEMKAAILIKVAAFFLSPQKNYVKSPRSFHQIIREFA